MTTSMIVGIAVLALAVAGIAIWYGVARQQRTHALQSQYGSEYDRTLKHASSRRIAEAELERRQERVEHFEIRPLLADQRDLFDQQWNDVQEMFVDNPGVSVSRADALVIQVMRTRGYPVANFEQRAADLSVNHSEFVRNYRAARDIADRHRHSSATTEELRRAMVYYREMFEDLLGPEQTMMDRPVERPVERDVALAGDSDHPEDLARPGRPAPRPDRRFDAYPRDDEIR